MSGPEYEQLVTQSGAEFAPLASLPGAFKSDAGEAVKNSNIFSLRRNSSALLGPLFTAWCVTKAHAIVNSLAHNRVTGLGINVNLDMKYFIDTIIIYQMY